MADVVSKVTHSGPDPALFWLVPVPNHPPTKGAEAFYMLHPELQGVLHVSVAASDAPRRHLFVRSLRERYPRGRGTQRTVGNMREPWEILGSIGESYVFFAWSTCCCASSERSFRRPVLKLGICFRRLYQEFGGNHVQTLSSRE